MVHRLDVSRRVVSLKPIGNIKGSRDVSTSEALDHPGQEIMTRGVVTVRPTAEIREAARVMHKRKIGALPVVDGDRVVGILTESDVLKALQSVLTEGVLAKPYRWALAHR